MYNWWCTENSHNKVVSASNQNDMFTVFKLQILPHLFFKKIFQYLWITLIFVIFEIWKKSIKRQLSRFKCTLWNKLYSFDLYACICDLLHSTWSLLSKNMPLTNALLSPQVPTTYTWNQLFTSKRKIVFSSQIIGPNNHFCTMNVFH